MGQNQHHHRRPSCRNFKPPGLFGDGLSRPFTFRARPQASRAAKRTAILPRRPRLWRPHPRHLGRPIFFRFPRRRNSKSGNAHLRKRLPPRQRLHRRHHRPQRHTARHMAIPFHRLDPRHGLPPKTRNRNQSRQRHRRIFKEARPAPLRPTPDSINA